MGHLTLDDKVKIANLLGIEYLNMSYTEYLSAIDKTVGTKAYKQTPTEWIEQVRAFINKMENKDV